MNRLIGLCLSAALCARGATIIRNAQIADGTGKSLIKGDVRVEAGKITAIGRMKAAKGDEVIDAKGLVLAPGFIDLHNHTTFGEKTPATAPSQIAQGITTIVVGQDGASAWPISDWVKQRGASPAALNQLTLIGHATLRSQVMGEQFQRTATTEEIAKMAELAAQGMREGAFGLSSGLEYQVGSYASTEELIALAKAIAPARGFYATHMRDEGDGTLDSIREAIRIGREGGVPVEISHIKLGSRAVWHKAPEAIGLIEQARNNGQDVTADCYPYEAWASTIKVLVLDRQYDNPVSVKKALDDVGGGENVTITHCEAHPDYQGKTLAAIAASQETTDVEVYRQVVRDGGASVIGKAMLEDDIRAFYGAPWVMVASDGGVGMSHPRGAGSYPRVLGVYVREKHWLTLTEAVRKMSGAPAERLRLTDRGRIATGMKADLVLFDPNKVRDRSTFQEPFLLPEGVDRVMVNGEWVWANGEPTGKTPGQVLVK